MMPEKWIVRNCARLRTAGFARLTLFLGIILLATPLRQEHRLFWLLLQLMLLDALIVSLSVRDMRRRLRWAFIGVWVAGFGANVGATLASRVESIQWWSVGTSSMMFLLLSSCVIVVLAYIFRSPRVTLDTMFAALSAYLLIALAFAALYS